MIYKRKYNNNPKWIVQLIILSIVEAGILKTSTVLHGQSIVEHERRIIITNN